LIGDHGASNVEKAQAMIKFKKISSTDSARREHQNEYHIMGFWAYPIRITIFSLFSLTTLEIAEKMQAKVNFRGCRLKLKL
jgi:hypothetical protein